MGGGPQELANVVMARTVIGDGYRKSAAYQSMGWYLNDWREARDRLDRQIAVLEELAAARLAEATAGLWPPAPEVETNDEVPA